VRAGTPARQPAGTQAIHADARLIEDGK